MNGNQLFQSIVIDLSRMRTDAYCYMRWSLFFSISINQISRSSTLLGDTKNSVTIKDNDVNEWASECVSKWNKSLQYYRPVFMQKRFDKQAELSIKLN